MATIEELAERLRAANPENNPMNLQWMAKIFWPDADWLKLKCRNDGARRGAVVAGGMAGKMAQRGLLRRHYEELIRGPVQWTWIDPSKIKK
ncbi:MAG: hypothetical protein ACTS9Y_00530 [Methylophilus sp.]|uniref:hypothetical protein n=1 Tax=Methylophilus sp. TaxID=29541 RepID=UPI003FA05A37